MCIHMTNLTFIITIHHFQESMNSSGSELWQETFSTNYKVQGEHSCRKLIAIFEDAHIDHFGLEASFMQEYQLEEFEKQWLLQNSSNDIEQYKGLKGKTKRYLQRPKDYPYEFIMDLGTETVRGMVFMQVYQDQLQQMKQEYQIKISTNGLRLYIFMRHQEALNIICKNRLYDMNHSLNLFYGHEPALVLILNASFLLRKRLLEKGVNVWFKQIWGRCMAIFFSIGLTTPQMLTIIQQTTKFDISIFNLDHKSINEFEAMSVKTVLHAALREDIAIIQRQYQIELQFSEDNNFIVFHTKHASFGIQPVAVFKERLNSIIVLSVRSRHIKDFDNKMRKFIKEADFATEMMSKKRNQTFIAIDLNKIHGKYVPKDIPKKVEEFLKLFLLLIQPQVQLKIYINHLTGDIQREHERLIEIAEKFNLVIRNQDSDEHKHEQKKVILRFKGFSENVLAKRQKELLLFLEALIALPPTQNSQAVSFLDEATLGNLGNLTSNSQILQSSNQESMINERFEIPWLKLKYAPPKRINFTGEDRQYIKGRRSRELQDVFNSSLMKFRVWSIQLSNNLAIPEVNTEAKPYLFKSLLKQTKISDTYQAAQLDAFKIKEQGTIGFLTNEIAMPVIPLFIFERIQ